ncbi:MAG: hypothetical protein KGO48_07365 [Alphaproteobacteria bacterium]|nr:hypothetical protein [Alphaproteobacteria bacterium]
MAPNLRFEGIGPARYIVELLKKIPPTEKGWEPAKRVRWFKTFAMIVSQIYDGDGEPVELKIELESAAK